MAGFVAGFVAEFVAGFVLHISWSTGCCCLVRRQISSILEHLLGSDDSAEDGAWDDAMEPLIERMQVGGVTASYSAYAVQLLL